MSWIAAARRGKGLTQKDLADIAGVSTRTMRRIESDGTGSPEAMRRIEEALGVTGGATSGRHDAGLDASVRRLETSDRHRHTVDRVLMTVMFASLAASVLSRPAEGTFLPYGEGWAAIATYAAIAAVFCVPVLAVAWDLRRERRLRERLRPDAQAVTEAVARGRLRFASAALMERLREVLGDAEVAAATNAPTARLVVA